MSESEAGFDEAARTPRETLRRQTAVKCPFPDPLGTRSYEPGLVLVLVLLAFVPPSLHL